MSKYQFHSLGSERFQEMVQSLLEQGRRNEGELVQFASAGADGAREATWTQSPNHPDYVRPEGWVSDRPKKWVFQVKYHDIGLRGWAGAGSAVVADLGSELLKVVQKYQLQCDHYVLITNVPLTGARRVGTRDRVSKIAEEWKDRIPKIEVWDAADLSRILDNNENVRTVYEEFIVAGDVLKALRGQLVFQQDRRESTFRGYLKNLIDNESKSRAEEAGDDEPLPLAKVFIDQTLQLDRKNVPECYKETLELWEHNYYTVGNENALIPEDLDEVSSSFPLLWGELDKVMLLAGPGYGKSTITQFLVLYHAARIIDSNLASVLGGRLKLPEGWGPNELDASCPIRFPFRVELRKYAKWRKTQQEVDVPLGIASYIARQLIGGAVESSLNQDDIFALISTNPALLILDGLDEVPSKDDRDDILRDCESFLYRCSGEGVNLQIVLSSRPQGYHGEFDRFQPLQWIINDLSEDDFYQYSADWLSERIRNAEERAEAEERIKRGMASDAVRRLATTLLQATVMLTIVRRKSDIPEERHKLFERYVEVVFQREITKNELVSRYEHELKLLHEMAGYYIHEAVSRGEAGVIPEGKFKDLVWTVWRFIRGDERLNSIPNQDIQNIYELSRDRLVFLSGKGTRQSDIDFVIQPYREFFAAKYMANHEQADPEKVFACLIERGEFWQQVLRFFVAMTLPAQRLLWSVGANFEHEFVGNIGYVVRTLPARRAVLFSLPEFGRLRFDQFRRVLSGCFPEHEWWTWVGQDWISAIVGNLRAGEGWREVWKSFNEGGKESYGCKEFALTFFPEIIPSNATEYSEFVEFVESCLKSVELDVRSLEVAIQYALPVNMALVSDDALFNVTDKIPYRRSRNNNICGYLLPKLSPSRAVRFLATAASYLPNSDEVKDIWQYLDIPVVRRDDSKIRSSQNGRLIVTVIPQWVQYSSLGQGVLPSALTVEGEYASYFYALAEALQNPDNALLDRKARSIFKGISKSINWSYRCENVLGPSPDDFVRDSEWVSYKTGMKEVYGSNEHLSVMVEMVSSYGGSSERSRSEWMLLLFPPSQWRLLSDADLVDHCLVERYLATKWAMTVGNRSEVFPVQAMFGYSDSLASSVQVPYLQLLMFAIDQHKKGELFDAAVVQDILSKITPLGVVANDLENIFNSIEMAFTLPRSWAGVLLSKAMLAEGLEVDVVINLWKVLNCGREDSIRYIHVPYGSYDRYYNVISKALDQGDDDLMDLMMVIIERCQDVPVALSNRINSRVVGDLTRGVDSPRRRELMFRCLDGTFPTVEEAKLYGDCESLATLLAGSEYGWNRLGRRISIMPQYVDKSDFGELRRCLHRLVENRADYPIGVGSTALDALLRLDVSCCSVIEEREWQIG